MYTVESSRLGLLCVAELILDLNRCSAVFWLFFFFVVFGCRFFFFFFFQGQPTNSMG